MNWGTGIFCVIVLFIGGILTLVFKASADQQQLVTTNYYEKELKYQNKIDAMNNVSQLSDTVAYTQQGRELLISFPDELKNTSIEAYVHLYCAFNEKYDQQVKTSTSDGTIQLSFDELKPGPYTAKLEWFADGKTYYAENKILIK